MFSKYVPPTTSYPAICRRLPITVLIVLVLSFSTYAMEYGWRDDFCNKDTCIKHIFMKGEIRDGDYQRFRYFMAKNIDAYIVSNQDVELDSPGGNLLEAFKMALMLKSMLAVVSVPKESVCASSCFLLFLGAPERSVKGVKQIGIHRPFFDRKYFASLSATDAEKKTQELLTAVNAFLEENATPRYLIERMNKTSSAEIYWLSADEINDIGKRAAWYEELLIAKCGLNTALEKKVDTDAGLSISTIQEITVMFCKGQIVTPELEKLKKTLEIEFPIHPRRTTSSHWRSLVEIVCESPCRYATSSEVGSYLVQTLTRDG